MSRIIRQFIYGVFYLALLSAAVYGVYLLVISAQPSCFDNRQNQGEEGIDCGGPCIPCAIKNLQSLRSQAQIFGIDGNTNAIITLANPNLNYGADSFAYTLNFYNSAKTKIFSLIRESFIYPAEAQKVIIEPNLRANFREISGEPELIISNINWKPIEEFGEPRVQTRAVRTEISGNLITASGLFVNRESIALSRGGIGAVVYQNLPDGGTRLVGASKTILQNLQPFEERAFKIIIPIETALQLSEIDTVLFTEAKR